MARVAVIADIHCHCGNLGRFLGEIAGRADVILCAGDLAGYGSALEEAIALVVAHGVVCVQGNHDLYAIGALEPSLPRRSLLCAVERSRREITPAAAAFLAALPRRLDLDLDGMRVTVTHGDLTDPERYVHEEDAPAYGQSLFGRTLPEGAVLFLGHTHVPYVVPCKGGLLCNPGSLGHPRQGLAPSYLSCDSRDPRGTMLLHCLHV